MQSTSTNERRSHLTFPLASAHAATTTPTVNIPTEKTCTREYRFPLSQPAAMVETLPKLRRMMWTGTLMSNAKAQLLSMLTAKNIAALRAHL